MPRLAVAMRVQKRRHYHNRNSTCDQGFLPRTALFHSVPSGGRSGSSVSADRMAHSVGDGRRSGRFGDSPERFNGLHWVWSLAA